MSRKLTTPEFQKRLDEIYGKGEFIVLGEYVNNATNIDILHAKCGNVIHKRPVKMTGSEKEGCYICSGKNHYKTRKILQEEVDKKFPGMYKILGDYVKARQPLKVQKISCGHVYDISPDNLLRGKGCPKCSIRQSSYMDITEEYLNRHNISFIKEKTFDDCKHIRLLPFDYYLEDYNTCIEVDGEFHYPVNSAYLNNESKYENVHMRDKIKTKYCIEHNINLIRLPYFEKDNFEEILDKELHVNAEITKAM